MLMLRLQLYIFQSDLLKKLDTILNILPLVLFIFLLDSFGLFDSSITFCMDCKYVQNAAGEIVVHPKTGEPLQNCSKTEFVVCMETIKYAMDKYMPPAADNAMSSLSTTDTTSNDVKKGSS